MKIKQRARLEDWTLINGDMLSGKVYGHPKLRDGTEVVTSRVAKLDLETGEAVTANTDYILGESRKSDDE